MFVNLPFLPSSFLTDSQGIASDTAYVVTASSGGGLSVFDLGGTDSLTFADAFPTLTKRTPSLMGFDRVSNNLYIDLNRDGLLVWTDDLMIRDFFANPYSPLPGQGFIETIGNLSGTDILDLDLLDYIPGTPGNDRLPGLGGSNYLTGGDGDDTYIIRALDGGRSSILDTSGTDALIFTDASPALEKMTFGVLGLGRFSTTLVVDLNRDGEFVGPNDLIILDFFGDSANAPGNGFIETIGNFSGTEILKLDFSTYFLGGDSSDTLSGRATNDTLVGGAGDDRLDGGAGNDAIRGGTEADLIVGGTGTDRLTGGDGADDFQFGDVSRSRIRATARMSIDRITDFEAGEDSIVLRRSTFGNVKRSDFRTVNTIAQARNSNAEIVYIQRTGALVYNQNGAAKGFGSGGQFADLTDGLRLTASDFSIAR